MYIYSGKGTELCLNKMGQFTSLNPLNICLNVNMNVHEYMMIYLPILEVRCYIYMSINIVTTQHAMFNLL